MVRVRVGVDAIEGESEDACEGVAWCAASEGVQLAKGYSGLRGAASEGVQRAKAVYLLHLGGEQVRDEDRLRVLELDALDQRDAHGARGECALHRVRARA
jgi:hypothetical protein